MGSSAVAIACLCLVAIVSAMDVKFDNCFADGDIGKASAVDITPCDKEPCALTHGTNVTFTLKFTPTTPSKKVTGVVHGTVFGVSVPFPIPHPDGCTESGLTCPLKTNQEMTYHSSFPIKALYPHINVAVKYELKGDDNKNLACIQISAHIV